jgi:hypothetical protein
MNFKNAMIALAATASLMTGCMSSTAVFNPIETRTTQRIVKLKMLANLSETGADATRSAGINLDIFRAKVMNTTTIRFVEGNEDASLFISFTPATLEGLIFKDIVQGYTIRVTENTGKVIYIVAGRLVAPAKHPDQLAVEMNNIFINRVIPVLEGKSPAAND